MTVKRPPISKRVKARDTAKDTDFQYGSVEASSTTHERLVVVVHTVEIYKIIIFIDLPINIF